MPAYFASESGDELSISRQFGETDEIELAGALKNCQECEKQRDTSDHRIDEELSCRRGAMWATPQSNQEERRDEAQLPEEEPVKKIQCRERSEQACLKK